MTKPKIIYLNPGEMLEVRFVNEEQGFFRNAKDWAFQTHPSKILMRLWPSKVVTADPQVRLSNKHDDWTDEKS